MPPWNERPRWLPLPTRSFGHGRNTRHDPPSSQPSTPSIALHQARGGPTRASATADDSGRYPPGALITYAPIQTIPADPVALISAPGRVVRRAWSAPQLALAVVPTDRHRSRSSRVRFGRVSGPPPAKLATLVISAALPARAHFKPGRAGVVRHHRTAAGRRRWPAPPCDHDRRPGQNTAAARRGQGGC